MAVIPPILIIGSVAERASVISFFKNSSLAFLLLFYIK